MELESAWLDDELALSKGVWEVLLMLLYSRSKLGSTFDQENLEDTVDSYVLIFGVASPELLRFFLDPLEDFLPGYFALCKLRLCRQSSMQIGTMSKGMLLSWSSMLFS